MGSKGNRGVAIVSKIYCSSHEEVLVVRRRPHVVMGGGFVVTDSAHNVIFRVDGCGVVGTRGQLILRDANGDALLLIRRKEGMVEALSIHRKWKGLTFDYEGRPKLVFILKEPKKSCLAYNNTIKISLLPTNNNSDFYVRGYFSDKDCTIVDSTGYTVAQIGVTKEIEELMASKDVYHVIIKPGMDKAFIFGVIAILDYIHHESTSC
ncbi:protein LURP-one-related 6 [Carica papaya]|uniref:protein LURP-one-related 6 n=1 Tax=Carica papaya TaxID=3649 RepID=UPI000B8C85CF|nr:protein LURP-one-related 6 [Carica papaya]